MTNDQRCERRPVLPEDTKDCRELFDDLYGVASGMECTGLIPAAPYDEHEIHSYSEIYDIPLSDIQTSDKPKNGRRSIKPDDAPDESFS